MRPRRLLVPEVIQISSMDCGPAALKCMLEGHGIFASYGRLREACQTDVDGTSIDTIEELAIQAGLDAAQTVIPADHLLLAEAKALPAILVTRRPNGMTHFLVVWSVIGGLVQVMDPATGRRWPTHAQLLREIYRYSTVIPAAAWRAWAGSSGFIAPLGRRLRRIGVPDATSKRLIDDSLSDPTWRGPGELDAAVRMVESIVLARGLPRGQQAARILAAFLEHSRQEPFDGSVKDRTIPQPFWTVEPVRGDASSGENLRLKGAVVLTVSGGPKSKTMSALTADGSPAGSSRDPGAGSGQPGGIHSPELVAALKEPPPRPWRKFLELMRSEGALTPALLLGAMALASTTVLLEALLFRSLFALGGYLSIPEQRFPASLLLIVLLASILLLELPIGAEMQRLGRKLEIGLRVAFLEKLPRLNDRYLQSRPTSDMADRCHAVHRLRLVPGTGGQFLRNIFELSLTTAGILWIDPASAPAALTLAVVSVVLPLATQPLLAERDLRIRSHAGALSRFYLDALLGLTPIRTHGAERAVRWEHESLLVEWTRAGRLLLRGALAVDGAASLISFGLAAWIFIGYLNHTGEATGALLLLYWALNLPVLGQGIAAIVRQYPAQRNIALRMLEPLGALEDGPAEGTSWETPVQETAVPGEASAGAAIRLEEVSVIAAGHTILSDINLSISAGEHVAVVGPSGAGKSTLIGLFLGWHRPASGTLLVDGLPLDGPHLDRLRAETAWVDPAVQLWNRSLLDNLTYGAAPGVQDVGRTIEEADLRGVLESMPDGLQTELGEGGALVSGGEGQRVRLGRAMIRQRPRLVLLDEPFRSLDRERRQTLLARARALWKGATLICVTHDIEETLGFERVLVIDEGKLVEDAVPAELAGRSGSRYRALLDTETVVQKRMWSSAAWRRLRVEHGQLVEPVDPLDTEP